MTTRLTVRIAEEETHTGPIPDLWGKSRRMRYELMNGGAKLSDYPGTGLFVAAKQLRDLGFATTKEVTPDGPIYRAARIGRPPGRPAKGYRPRRAPEPERKPRPLPPFGAELTVVALIAEQDVDPDRPPEVVIGLRDRDGRQWFAVLTEPPNR